jgi:hypothetical protein
MVDMLQQKMPAVASKVAKIGLTILEAGLIDFHITMDVE